MKCPINGHSDGDEDDQYHQMEKEGTQAEIIDLGKQCSGRGGSNGEEVSCSS